MCGINGIIPFKKLDLELRLNAMNRKIIHRGPDRNAIWIKENNEIGLSHVRLSILDLTESGNQPMCSHSNRYIIVFNGEIYNHQEIKQELERILPINWRGTSDTEILLEAIELLGLSKTLKLTNGMFAFALYDKQENTLTLTRDRMGEKPLYYGFSQNNFVFSSEISAIASLPEFDNPISKNSLGLFFQYSAIPEPYSIYENIFKLPSGSYLEYHLNTQKHTINYYWNIESNPEKSNFSTPNDAVDALDKLISSSIGLQMQADVPTGAFLSGGIDSSTIAAIMQAMSPSKIDTFSIGFHEKSFNEADFAKKVAHHIGSNHHELYVGEKDLLDVVPNLSSMYSEPFSEASQIPTFLVAQLAKQKVTVSLSGDAGDELFGGYWRYHFTNDLWNKISKFPIGLRQTLVSVLQSFPYQMWKFILSPLSFKKGSYGEVFNYPDKMLKLLPFLKMKSEKELYHRGIMTHNPSVDQLIPGFIEPETLFTSDTSQFDNIFEMMMYFDTKTYLPNNNLTKVDRAAMAVSLETRVPLLDHRIVSFAQSLPLEYKIRNGIDKWILKQVLYKYVPEDYFKRPKKGFGVPLETWLRGPLKDWAFELLKENKIKNQGFFNNTIVQKYWEEHQSGKRNWSAQIWDILMFQDWLEKQKNK
ncbi:MAG TPA: asparagine synthase (glutamine-hydrolyzing) [Edaphocola sp.]|nr:asparagine synthase (glutamine-hydrolyzing) [Edaphocola sp.]